MRYSVWNINTRQFDYFDTPEPQGATNTPKPDHIVARTLGSTVEQAAWPLPAGATPAGSGPHAIGRVAAVKRAGALGADDGGVSLVTGGLLLVAGALGVKYLLPKKRGR